jgi:hypothetical protein
MWKLIYRYMKTYIYGLRDPRTNKIEYVGKSNNPQKRYYSHTGQARRGNISRKCDWIRELSKDGLKPLLEIIEECAITEWNKRELYWMDKLQPTTNAHRGGGSGILYYKQKSKITQQFDINMNLLNEYISLNEAARQTGFSVSNISNACNEKYNIKHIGKFIWRIKGRKYNKKPAKVIKESRKLGKYSYAEKLIETFNSVSEASKLTGIPRTSISNCCFFNKEEFKNSAYGYMWKFIDPINII